MSEIAGWFDRDASRNGEYKSVAEDAHKKVIDPSRTPSARLLNEMESSGQSFGKSPKNTLAMAQEHLSQPYDKVSALANSRLKLDSSVERQQDLEAHNEPLRGVPWQGSILNTLAIPPYSQPALLAVPKRAKRSEEKKAPMWALSSVFAGRLTIALYLSNSLEITQLGAARPVTGRIHYISMSTA